MHGHLEVSIKDNECKGFPNNPDCLGSCKKTQTIEWTDLKYKRKIQKDISGPNLADAATNW